MRCSTPTNTKNVRSPFWGGLTVTIPQESTAVE